MAPTDLAHKRPAQLVEKPTGPASPPPMPDPEKSQVNPHLISMWGACAGIGASLPGLVHTASTAPDLIGIPITITLAATVATAVNAFRHDRWNHLNPA